MEYIMKPDALIRNYYMDNTQLMSNTQHRILFKNNKK